MYTGDNMEKDKTIRVSDEIMTMITAGKEDSVSISSAIAAMLEKYEPVDRIVNDSGKFVLVIGSTKINVPTFTPVNKIVRIAPDTYDKLSSIKAYPDESYNMILFRLMSVVNTPYENTVSKYNAELNELVYKYIEECEIDNRTNNFVDTEHQLNVLLHALEGKSCNNITNEEARKLVKDAWCSNDIKKKTAILQAASLVYGAESYIEMLFNLLKKEN